ncbi:MAG TPA: GNAT family N-acetyltransferase [Thermomicrobiales bacterium]|jgi:N-acetylglutamate synthase|nr:GNAT family N-acetyltransferase [Thermomicrobiales bacterium]
MDDLSTLERVALRACPAAVECWLGQWLLRFGGGYTKRANSAYVMGIEPDLDSSVRIEAAAAMMREQDLPLIIRESSLAVDPRISEALRQRGFHRIDETIVMTAALPDPSGPEPEQVDLDTWLALYQRFEGGTRGSTAQYRTLLTRIEQPTCYGVLRSAGEPVTIGQAVADGDWVGLYAIATDPARRRQGYGRSVVQRLLAWGSAQGATRSYLQVIATNTPAVSLYEQLGYVESYRYWYWVQKSR